MNLSDNYQCEGQMTLADILDQDIWSGKMSKEPSAPTKGKTSGASSKKQRKSSMKMPLFLCLKKENGKQVDSSWETDGVSLGECMTHSFGEFLSADNGSVWYVTSTDTPQETSYLMLGLWEKPTIETPSKLSQILEKNPDPKYNLSAKACQGILNRANKRGKQLPPLLERTLIQQAQSLSKNEPESPEGEKASSSNTSEPEPYPPSTSSQSCLNPWDVQSKHIQPEDGIAESLYSGECRYGGGESYVMQESPTAQMYEGYAKHKEESPIVYGIGAYESNAMKSPNPRSGIYEAQTARTLDNNGGNPACNQGGMAVVQNAEPILLESNQNHATIQTNGISTTLPASMGMGGGYTPMVCIEGNGSRKSHLGNGYKESDVMYTLNTVEQHAVLDAPTETYQETTGALCASGYNKLGTQEAMNDMYVVQPTYGLDRASFNQGQGALYDFAIDEELSAPLVARGPNGVMTQQGDADE